MTATHKNFLKTTISAVASSGLGALTISTASSGYRTFGSGDDGKTFDGITIKEGTAWEVRDGCVYTHSGTSLSRGTLMDSSTGSAIAFTSAAVVQQGPSAEFAARLERVISGYIVGLDVSYSSTTAVAVASGTLSINGVQRPYTGATYTSGSTMKDLANSTVTIGASKCYFLYAYNNAGTVEIRFEERDGTGDGADPTFDSTLNYWKAATTGAEARRIGKFWTNASSQVIKFLSKTVDRKRTFFGYDRASLSYVSAGSATSFTSFATTPYVTADDSLIFLEVFGERQGSTGQVLTALSIDETNEVVAFSFDNMAVGFYSLGVPFALPASATLYYKTATNSRSYVRLLQTECQI